MKKNFFFLLLLIFAANRAVAQDDSVKVRHHPVRRAFAWRVGAPVNGYCKNRFIFGPDLSVSGDGEFFFGTGLHLDWISTRPGHHDGHWQFCDHIFTAQWNWYSDYPYHFGIDLEYDMFRSYSGYGKQRFKFIGGVKVSHLY